MTTEAQIEKYIVQQRAVIAASGRSEFWKQIDEMTLAGHVQFLRRGLRSLVTVTENGVERLVLQKEQNHEQ